jgi:hypothetical protein
MIEDERMKDYFNDISESTKPPPREHFITVLNTISQKYLKY